ncbi:MAG: ABC transporter permease [Planctomycetota bacterium]
MTQAAAPTALPAADRPEARPAGVKPMATPARGAAWPAAAALWKREVKRFFRQRNRVVGAVATPLVFWLLLGLGLNRTFSPPAAVADAAEEVGYLEYFFPGAVTLMVLFTAIFATISVIEDRREGFLQGVLASPAPRWALVLGKVLGGASIATAQGVFMLLIGVFVFGLPSVWGLLAAVAAMFVVAVGLTGLGLALAWPMDSTAGYHAVMNLLLMPMWLLCGAVFPVDSAGPLKWVMLINPLTYGHAAFAGLLRGGDAAGLGLPLGVALGLTVLLAGLAVAWATRVAGKKVRA